MSSGHIKADEMGDPNVAVVGTDDNPYKSPAVVQGTDLPESPMATWFATVLLVVWFLEGSVKLVVFVPGIFQGGANLASLEKLYRSIGAGWFVPVCVWFIFETIGPWFGVAYLIRCKRGLLTFGQALKKVLTVVGALSLVATALLVVLMEIT